MPGIIGKKLGMTRVFNDEGAAVSVTVIEAGPCPVVQVKDQESDGYRAVQLGFGTKKAKRTPKAEAGHAARAGLEGAPAILREFRAAEDESYEAGATVTVDIFTVGDRVKVTGKSKGKGFQGVVKRHGFTGRPGSHGHPESRNPGSIGPGTDPSRVIKGKRLPGQTGNVRRTVRNLEVVRVDADKSLLFVKGGVPGPKNAYLLISK